MPAYAEMAGKSWRQTVGLCTWATAGDVVMALGIYGLISFLLRNAGWGIKPRINARIYMVVALLGITFAVLVEKLALGENHWSYTDQMPLVPGLDIGLWPFIQLAVLTPLALWMTRALLRARMK